MTPRYTLIALITLSMACSGSETEGEGDNTGPTAQEELCADYPEGIQCPILPSLEDGTVFTDWTPKVCPPGYMAEFGKDNCISIGEPCPEGDWPENLPTSNVKYVMPGGTGDGSSPQNAAGSIQQMLDGSNAGSTIALSKGVFNESIDVTRAQHIVGACARDSTIDGLDGVQPSDSTVFIYNAAASSLKNVTIRGNRLGIVVYETLAPVVISGVIVQEALGLGLFIQKGEVELDTALITGTRSMGDGSYGWGTEIKGGSDVVFSQVNFDGNRDVAIDASEESTTVNLSKVVVQNTLVGSDGTGGRGIQVSDSAQVMVSHLFLTSNQDTTVLVSDLNSRFIASDLVIGNTDPELVGGNARGLAVSGGAELNLTRAFLNNTHDVGIFVAEEGSSLNGRDILIQNTQSDANGAGGRGMNVQRGARATLSNVFLNGNRDVGLIVFGDDTLVNASNLVVLNTRVSACAENTNQDCPWVGGGWGDGFVVIGGAEIVLNNFSIQDNARVALYFYDVSGTGYETMADPMTGAPTVAAENGNIINNQYGINIRGGSVTPSDFTMVACYDNEKTVDGCYSEMDLAVPDPSSLTEDPAQ